MSLWLRGLMVLTQVWLLSPIAFGQTSEFLKPPADASDVPRLLESTTWVRGLTEAELVALVPRQSGLRYVGCPNCRGGRQENQLEWNPSDPQQIYCRYCQHRFPSQRYPMTETVTVRTPLGQFADFPYWADERGYRYFFEARRSALVREYLSQRTRDLALLYRVTGDRLSARRVALILDCFAEHFPNWCYHYDYPFQQKTIYDGPVAPSEFRSGYRTSRWTWWAYSDVPHELLEAYYWIARSGVLLELSAERGFDVAERIERDLFRNACDQVMANPESMTNMSPRAWRSMVDVGRVLGEPRYVHEVIQRMGNFVDKQFFYDGSWHEGSTDYAEQTLSGLQHVMASLQGYSDPPAYVHPETRRRVDALEVEGNFPMLERAQQATRKLHLPDGRSLPIHDAWPHRVGEKSSSTSAFLLPALGHACLGGGQGEKQTQCHLTWSGGYGHSHADNLSLLLYAAGHEVLSDLGYTHTAYRAWTLATAAHNTVVIDGQNQRLGRLGEPTDGSLIHFDASDPQVQVASADGRRAYPGLAQTYRRTVIALKSGDVVSYVVDVFEVEGGSQHDYFLHGSADESNAIQSPVELHPLPSLLPSGMQWQPTQNEGQTARISEPYYAYGFLNRLRSARMMDREAIELTFQIESQPAPALRVWLLPEPGDSLVLGENPSIRQADEDDARLDDFQRPFGMLRRQPNNGRSTFVTVLQPPGTLPEITQVTRLQSSSDVVALAIAHGNHSDVVCYSFERSAMQVAVADGFQFDGQIGVLRFDQKQLMHAYGIGGSGWLGTNVQLQSAPEQTVALVGLESQALLVSMPTVAPRVGDVVRMVTADGWVYPYCVTAVAQHGGDLKLEVASGPGAVFDASSNLMEFRTFPQRTHRGSVQVRWCSSAFR